MKHIVMYLLVCHCLAPCLGQVKKTQTVEHPAQATFKKPPLTHAPGDTTPPTMAKKNSIRDAFIDSIPQQIRKRDSLYVKRRVIEGTVGRENAGSTITLKGTKIATVAGQDGYFRLIIPDSVKIEDLSLISTNINYNPKEIKLRGARISKVSHARLPPENPTAPGTGYTLYSISIPGFDWPPPTPTTYDVMDNALAGNVRTLGDLDIKLTKALKVNSYPSASYYQVPNGFAMVTRIERLDEDSPDPDLMNRWDIQADPGIHSISDYIKALFTARKGYFRVIVFFVTDQPITSSSEIVNQQDAMAWLMKGSNLLPDEIGQKPYTSKYHNTAYVYEFEKPENSEAILMSETPFPANQQLQKIYNAF